MATKTKRATNGKANGRATNPAFSTAAIRDRFEDRLDDVRTRFRSFEKDWSKTVDKLVTRGRSAEKDLRKRLDKVSKDLNKSQIVSQVKKNPTFKRLTNQVVTAVKGFNYEKTIKDLRRDVKGFQADVVDFFQSSTTRAKKLIDLPSRSDFDRLHRKIESLSTQVRSLEKRKR